MDKTFETELAKAVLIKELEDAASDLVLYALLAQLTKLARSLSCRPDSRR